MFSFNGIGTTFYGKKELKNDDSFITTKWFIFLLLPIFPLGTYRIKKIQKNKLSSIVGLITEYQIIEKLSLDKKQVILWYASVYGSILIIFLILFLIIVKS